MYVFVRTSPQSVPRRYEPGIVVDYLDDQAASTLDTDVERRLVDRLGVPSPQAIDLLLLAAGVYTGDKRILRSDSPDGWTRRIGISLPSAHTRLWQDCADDVVRLLSFLTGDNWSATFRRGQTRLRTAAPPLDLDRFDAVCLFSGGMDSCVGAIDLLESGKRIVLIGHYDAGHTKRDQRAVFEDIEEYYGPDRVALIQARLRPSPVREAQEYPLPVCYERTTRSRSIVFLSLGIAAAAAVGLTIPLYAAENAFISINVPLVQARMGSLSTRTTHPYTLHLFRRVLRGLGIMNEVRTPYEGTTKGEMLKKCKNQELLERVIRKTVSCSHPEVGRWKGRGYGHCGYCLPCIVRRAAMWSMNWEEDGYMVDVRLIPENRLPTGGRDLRAVKSALIRWKRGDQRIRWNGPLPLDASQLERLDRARMRGLQEIRRFVDSGPRAK